MEQKSKKLNDYLVHKASTIQKYPVPDVDEAPLTYSILKVEPNDVSNHAQKYFLIREQVNVYLYYCASLSLIVLGILFITLSNSLKTATNKFTILYVAFIVIGIITFFIARGLTKRKKWAKITASIFTAIATITGAIKTPQYNFWLPILIILFGLYMQYVLYQNKIKKMST
jgi:lysylphosphatidylglycerol synthetase-like protein (DUF2156 family)